MKTSDSENRESLFARYRPGRRFYVFLVSLILASAFWFLNAMNKTYVEAIHVAIKYVNLPVNRAFAPLPPKQLQIEIAGDGFSLFSLMQEADEDTVVVDVSSLDFEAYGMKQRAVISTAGIVNKLKASLSNNANVSRVNLDTIQVFTEHGEIKDIPVKPNFELNLASGVVLKSPVYTLPEMVALDGPISVLDQMAFINTEQVQMNDVSEHSEFKAKIIYNKQLLTPSHKWVTMVVDVEPLTEGEITIPIEITNLPKGHKVRLLPASILVKYVTGLSHYDFIEADLFHASVSYADINNAKSKLPVTITSKPSYVNVIQFTPQRVDYLILETDHK